MRAIIAAAVLLLPMAVRADDQPSVTAGQARDVPLLISDTSWNYPHGVAWKTNEPVPKGSRDDRFVEFTNTQDKEIAEIRLHVYYCGTRGSSRDAGWMEVKGPFAAHGSFKTTPSLPSGGSITQSFGGFSGASVSNHLLIKEVVVVDSDGSLYQYGSDVAKVLSVNVSNFCANY
ncbi:MAG TPA: hypothetical protein VGM47_07665 [Gammaproteobacteria bacterium]|jgi:hypothetical protein